MKLKISHGAARLGPHALLMGVNSSFAIFSFFNVENAFERLICLVACLIHLCRLLSMLKCTGQSDFYGIIINIFVLSLLKFFPFRGCVELELLTHVS